MNDKNKRIANNPVYKTKSEVMKVANKNRPYFNNYSDSLKNAWKFYN